MQMTERTVTEIPRNCRPGEIWFSINLGLVDDVPELYRVLQRLNLSPQLAYMQTRDGVEVHLLLHHEVRADLFEPPNELFGAEQQVLADAINTDAIHFACGLVKRAA